MGRKGLRREPTSSGILDTVHYKRGTNDSRSHPGVMKQVGQKQPCQQRGS